MAKSFAVFDGMAVIYNLNENGTQQVSQVREGMFLYIRPHVYLTHGLCCTMRWLSFFREFGFGVNNIK